LVSRVVIDTERLRNTKMYEDIAVKAGDYPEGEHPLETQWTFWFDRKPTHVKKDSNAYMDGLAVLGTFNTIESFYRHYAYMARPSDMPRDYNISCFRKGFRPMWEEFPEGGCWIIRIKRKAGSSYVNRMWENLLLAVIGEALEIPDVVGCFLSTRPKDDVLSIWNRSNENSKVRYRIGEKLKDILDLDMNALIQYKEHMSSLKDFSTYRNATNYIFAPTESKESKTPGKEEKEAAKKEGAAEGMKAGGA